MGWNGEIALLLLSNVTSHVVICQPGPTEIVDVVLRLPSPFWDCCFLGPPSIKDFCSCGEPFSKILFPSKL